MGKTSRVSVIIVNWNGARYLSDCIGSVKKQSVSPVEMIVIDNNSSDASWEILKPEKEARIVLNAQNVGFSAACNQGIRISQAESILVMNPDVVLEKNYLDEVLRTLALDPWIGSVMGRVLRFDHQTIDTCGQVLGRNRRVYELGYGEVDRGQYRRPGEVFSVCGAVAFYRRAMLEDIAINGEYFDEDFFAFYEDMDLGWRARNRGWKSYYTSDAIAYHYRGGTNSPRVGGWQFWRRYEFTRRPCVLQRHIILNRYLMIIKNDRLAAFLRDLPFILAFEILLWGYVLLFRPGLLRNLLRGFGAVRRAFEKRRIIHQRDRVSHLWRDKPVA